MPETFTLRMATVADVDTIARQRAAMFLEMGDLAEADRAPLTAATADYLRVAIPAGEYIGWLASPADASSVTAGGGGVQLRPLLPRPNPHGDGILTGRQGLILNMYVEPRFRRNGLGRHLVETVLAWARANHLASVVLHASPAGRPLYEALGFVTTNEMRYGAPVAAAHTRGDGSP